MRVLNLLAKGETGGIETLCVDIAVHSKDENYFYFLWGGGVNAQKIKSTKCNVIIRRFKYCNIIKEYIFLKKYCKNEKIDVIVCQGVSPVMMLFTKMLNAEKKHKTVLYLHANAKILFDTKSYAGKASKILYKHMYKKIDGLIAISYSVKKSIEEMFGTSEKVDVIYNGIEVGKFSCTDKENKENKKITIMYVGRLSAYKNVELLIKAIHYIQIDCKVIIVGDGAERCNLKELVEELKLTDKIEFVGVQTDVPNWLAKADVFVHPALCEEGFGISLVESMAASVPCIAFNKGAIGEIISDNENGFIVDGESYYDLANKIKEVSGIYSNKDKWNIICSNAYERARVFDVKNYVSKLQDYYENL